MDSKYDMNTELLMLEASGKHLDDIRNIHQMLIDRLKIKEQIIDNLVNMLEIAEKQISELKQQLVCKEEESAKKTEELNYLFDYNNYSIASAACAGQCNNDTIMSKVRPIGKDGNMKNNK